MAYDQICSNPTGTEMFFSLFKHQTTIPQDRNQFSPHFPLDYPSSSLVPTEPLSDTTWREQEDPYQLMNVQSLNKNRNCADGNGCGSESDLYGLVSDILEEKNQIDNLFAERTSPNLKFASSLNSLMEDSQQYLHLESNMQSSSLFMPSPSYSESCNRRQRQLDKEPKQNTEFQPHFSNSDITENWGFPHNNRKFKTSSVDIQLGSSLDQTSTHNYLLPNPRPGEADYCAVEKVGRFCTENSPSDHMDTFPPECVPKMVNEKLFDPFTEYTNQRAVNVGRSRLEEENNLANSIQALLMCEDDTNNSQPHKRQSQEHEPLPMGFVYKMPSSENRLQKELAGSIERQRTSDHNIYMKPHQNDYQTNNLSRFHQEAKFCLGSLNPSSPFPSKHTIQNVTGHPEKLNQRNFVHYQNQANPLKINNVMPAFAKMASLSGLAPQMQNEYILEEFPSLPAQNQMGLKLERCKNEATGNDFNRDLENMAQFSNLIREDHSFQPYEAKMNESREHAKQWFPQKPFVGGTHGIGKFAPEKSQVPPFLQCIYAPGNLFRSANSALPYGNALNLSNMLTDIKLPSFNPYFPDLMGAQGLLSQRLTKKCLGPTSQLHYYLEKCCKQWRMLEKERKTAETVLASSFPGQQILSASSSPVLKVPPNPSRVDRLIVGLLREQSKVVSLLRKMEQLRSFPLHTNICTALDQHLEAIYITQARRKEEFFNTSCRQRQAVPSPRDERDILLLAAALNALSNTTRKTRTVLWCTLQVTLPRNAVDVDEPSGSQP